jgi:hypothetical protein
MDFWNFTFLPFPHKVRWTGILYLSSHACVLAFHNCKLLWYFSFLIRFKLCMEQQLIESRDSAVSMVTGYGLEDQGVGVQVPVQEIIFTSPCHPDWLWGPPSLLSNGYWCPFLPGIKRLGCETDNSPPNCAEFKKTWVYTSTLSHVFHVVVLN